MRTGRRNFFCAANRYWLKINFEAGVKGALARQLEIIGERIEFVVPIAEVQNAKANFGVPVGEAITGKQIELPEIVARLIGAVAAIGLAVPKGIGLGKKSARQIINGKDIELMQCRLLVLVDPGRSGRGW